MKRSPLVIAHVASEMTPLAKVGGLADMVGALAAEQARRGDRVFVALPRYGAIHVPQGWARRALEPQAVPWGMGTEAARFELVSMPGGPQVMLVDHAGERKFFDRPGVYDDPRTGEGWPDGAERFLFFARAAVQGLAALGERFDVLHAHDHQAGWVPCFARTHEAAQAAFEDVATVFTIHNLGYQGIYDAWVLGLAGFGLELFHAGSPFEFFGRVNQMKVGLSFADALTTVSPRYAVEIRSSGEFGFGLEGVLRRRAGDLTGILNGIDAAVWNPASDPHLACVYDRDHLDGKDACRDQLRRECEFPAAPDWPIVGMVSRLVEQKGFDLIEQAADELGALEARFVVLGSGPPRYQELMRRLEQAHRGRFRYFEGYNDPLAHRIEAGADLYLMPSRYEPCGLNQMYSLRYGTPPIVRDTGGLADSVEEFDPLSRRGTGFKFERFDAGDMLIALRHAIAIHRQTELRLALQRNGMAVDFSWAASADQYERLYRETRARVAAVGPPTLDSVRALVDIGPRAARA
jgi:starch synthase